MTREHAVDEGKSTKACKRAAQEQPRQHAVDGAAQAFGLIHLQHQVGNQAVQRLIAQRSGDGGSELDDETADRIKRERGGGQPLDESVQKQAGAVMDQDFSGVRVHTSPEADGLSHQLSAKAFTTGQDVFFREGAYDPGSSAGQELIAHELTHVVQQRTGAVGGDGGRMAVNAPGDAFEKEADTVAKTISSPGAAAEVQRQTPEEDEEVQAQVEEEEEEEEPVQAQEMEEEEEEEEAA